MLNQTIPTEQNSALREKDRKKKDILAQEPEDMALKRTTDLFRVAVIKVIIE
jgi:hypothetical protein